MERLMENFKKLLDGLKETSNSLENTAIKKNLVNRK